MVIFLFFSLTFAKNYAILLSRLINVSDLGNCSPMFGWTTKHLSIFYLTFAKNHAIIFIKADHCFAYGLGEMDPPVCEHICFFICLKKLPYNKCTAAIKNIILFLFLCRRYNRRYPHTRKLFRQGTSQDNFLSDPCRNILRLFWLRIYQFPRPK